MMDTFKRLREAQDTLTVIDEMQKSGRVYGPNGRVIPSEVFALKDVCMTLVKTVIAQQEELTVLREQVQWLLKR
jgi:hypothetical protein